MINYCDHQKNQHQYQLMGNNTITNNNYIVPCTFSHEEKYVLVMNVIMKINSKWVENIQIIRDFFIF